MNYPRSNISALFSVFLTFLFVLSSAFGAPPKSSGTDAAAPTTPSGLVANAPSCSQVNLSWNGSTDQGTKSGGKTYTSGLLGYNVYRGGLFIKQVLAPATTTTDTGLAGSTYYSYTVRAVDNAGNISSAGTAANITTPACPTCSATVTVLGSPSSGGSVSGGQTVTCGSSVTVSAAANAGYNFANWTDNGIVVSSSSPYTFAANANRTLVANFSAAASPTYVTISTSSSPSGTGSTTSGGTVVSGTTVSVSASAYAGYTFANWTENGTVVSSTATFTFPATVNRSLVANFTATSCTYTINRSSSPAAGGTTSGGGVVNCGSVVTMTAAANAGYTFANWTENGAVISTSPIYTFTANANRSLVANFTTAPTSYSITTSSSPAAGGSASGGGSFLLGALVTLTATPSAGYTFVNWTENGTVVSSASSFALTVGGNRSFVANFSAVSNPGPWAKRFGSSGNDSGCAVAVDSGGNVYLAGYFQGAADFGGGALASAGGYDIVLAKYSATGAHVWSKRFGSVGDEVVKAIALDASGNIYLGGYFMGTANFGGADMTSSPVNVGDAFLAKYSPQGAPLWSLSFGGTYSDQVNGIAVDSQGNAIVTGFFQGVVTIAGTILYDYGQADTFLAKFSPTGVGLWSKNFPPNGGFDQGNSIAVDRADNIYITGTAANYINLGGEAFGVPGGYLAKLNSSGGHIWSRMVGTNTAARIGGLALDSNGDVALCGSFYHQTDLGGGLIYGNSGGFDLFVAKYGGADGSFRWARSSTGGLEAGANAVVVDAQNNLILTGVYRGTYTIGPSTISNFSTTYDGFVAKYNSSGTAIWAQGFGGADSDSGTAIAISSGSPVVTGCFSLTATCGGQSLTSAGSTDVLLMKLNP